MKFLNELLGFAVLTGPLWLILILLPIAIWVAVKVAKRFKRGSAKIGIGLLVFLLVFLVPFGDEIAGRIYFSHLCATEAGTKVYRAVELPAEYWDEQGKPKYLAANGFVDMKLLPNRFGWHNVDDQYIDSVIKIEKRRWQLMDKETQTVLGERITYMRHLGWINRFSPAPNIGEGCRDLGGEFNRDELIRKEREQEQMFFRDILRPATSTR
jgi:hypothetical protein